jgi:NADH-quinone oxidoreductase subunit F
MEFCMTESCGKCVPCRVGTVQMHELLKKIIDRNATARDLALLEELCDMVKNTSLCGLGQTAPNPVLTTLRYFREEYEAHLHEHRCPAGRCPALIRYRVTDNCIGCTLCAQACPVGAIAYRPYQDDAIEVL